MQRLILVTNKSHAPLSITMTWHEFTERRKLSPTLKIVTTYDRSTLVLKWKLRLAAVEKEQKMKFLQGLSIFECGYYQN